MSGALNAKLHFAISVLTFERIRSMFKKRGLKVTISPIDKGVLNLVVEIKSLKLRICQDVSIEVSY